MKNILIYCVVGIFPLIVSVGIHSNIQRIDNPHPGHILD